jgi:ABC-type transport system involved in cytochrome c biogenesis permease subunit
MPKSVLLLPKYYSQKNKYRKQKELPMSLALYVTAIWAVVIIYVFATITNVSGIIFEKKRLERYSYVGAWLGLTVHGIIIAIWWKQVGHGPYMAPTEVLSSDSWMVMFCFLIFLKLYPRIREVSILVFPTAFLMLALSLFYNPGIRTLPTSFRSIWLVIHIGLYKVSLATLVIGFAFSVFYLRKTRKSTPWLERLPECATLDAYAYRFAGFGFIFWTIGMLAGSIWAYQSWGRFWGWDPVEVWSLVTCLLFGLYLHLRRFYQMQGIRAAWLFIFCFVVSLLALFVMSHLSTSIHAEYFK